MYKVEEDLHNKLTGSTHFSFLCVFKRNFWLYNEAILTNIVVVQFSIIAMVDCRTKLNSKAQYSLKYTFGKLYVARIVMKIAIIIPTEVLWIMQPFKKFSTLYYKSYKKHNYQNKLL